MIVVVVIICAAVSGIIVYIFCHYKLKQESQIQRMRRSQEGHSIGRSTDLSMVDKSDPKEGSNQSCADKIKNDVLSDLEKETALIKYKSDSVESIDARPRTHV